MAQPEENHNNTLDQLEENQHNTLAQQKENQHNTLDQQEENQHNTLAQPEENQHNTMAQQKENQPFADFFEQFMPRPLAEFLDHFLNFIYYVINICLILTILHWVFGIEIGTRIYGIGVLALWTHGIYCVVQFLDSLC